MNKDSSNKKDETKGLQSQSIIKRWDLCNFQSIEDESLFLKPLTIFSGPNSSGKSAVIKSLLMVAQSLDSSAWEVPLVLNGKYTQLGDFDHILNHGSDLPEIELGFILKRQKENIDVWVKIEKDPDSLTSMRVVEHEIKLGEGWKDEDSEPLKSLFNLKCNPDILQEGKKQKASQILQEQIDQGLFDYEINTPKGIESHPQYEKTVSASLSNFLPGRRLIRVDSEIRNVTEEFEQAREGILSIVEGMTPSIPIDWDRELSGATQAIFKRIRMPKNYEIYEIVEFIANSREPWKIRQLKEYIEKNIGREIPVQERESRIQERKKSRIQDLARRMSGTLAELQDNKNNYSDRSAELEVGDFPPQYSQIIQQIRRVFRSQIFYLGPLRDDPRTIYAIPPLPNQRDVGLKGEYTAAMLEIHQNLIIDYPLPPPLEKFDGVYKIKRGKLGEAVRLWLDRMGLAKSFNTTMTSKVGYQLEVRPEGVKQDLDLMSLGVGVSQVLPTIVMALLAPEDSVLIFEQPEVHLHPKVQSVLGDFFLGIVGCGKQCIVETHSEHLINRIRRRIAESRDKKILQQLQIYFVELEDGVSQFRPVKPNEFGAIMDWPTDFFDEAEKESSALIRAAMEKHRAPRK